MVVLSALERDSHVFHKCAVISLYAKSFKNKENYTKFAKRLFKSRLIYRLDQVT